jgi:hypothetical protein
MKVRGYAMAKRKPAPPPEGKRKYLSQADVPVYGLEHATKVAQAIADNYGKIPTKPLRVAQALNVQPLSSNFRMLCGASLAYGLTEGGYNSEMIAITPLGRRIVAPTKEGDDFAAKREALLRPRVVRDFLTRYNESKLPNETIGRNVLEELGVPAERTKQVFAFIVESASAVGYLRDLKGSLYVDLDGAGEPPPHGPAVVDQSSSDAAALQDVPPPATTFGDGGNPSVPLKPAGTRSTNRVFITHGKNKEIVAQLKEVLTFGKFTPVLALETETVSKPVSDKVMDEMRDCQAAIIHVGTEQRLLDADGREHRMLNQNVLIEVGAAMALYGRNFILLVENGVTLPSNLQGLYEVRYAGDKLDYEATMKLLKAFNDFRA